MEDWPGIHEAVGSFPSTKQGRIVRYAAKAIGRNVVSAD